MNRVELHCHSHYSLMDGLNTPQELVEVAAQFEMPAISITDHGTLSGHRDMQDACLAAGIKPILGVEAYISPTDRFDRRPVAKRDDNTALYNHTILLAKSEQGLKNLHHMSREAWQSGYYHKPRIDWELLDEFGDDIIVLSGCMNGLIPKAFERGELDEAQRLTEQYRSRFGEDFYLEVQAHNPKPLNDYLFSLGERYNIQTVATTDCHFTRPELRWVEEAMLILSTSPKLARGADYASTSHITDIFERLRELYPERPISFEEIDVYLMNRQELEHGFDEYDKDKVASAIENSLAIADKIDSYEYIKDANFLPDVSENPDAALRKRAVQGLKELGLSGDEYVNRLNDELEIIARKQFSSYFLIVEDAITWARSKDILVGPGRGSAAGSLVCYALGITMVDPIKYDLLFFRFIDDERSDWPDIDVDFEKSRRGEVKEYIRRKYGHVASISNFIYFTGKGVVRDAARVYAVPVNDVNRALKQVEAWEDFLVTTAEDTVKFRAQYPEVIELAEHLRGRIRSVGMHAAGLVTSSVPLEDFAPFETRPDPNDKVSGRVPVVAWDMKQCADVGLIKLDILGLNTLDVIHDTLRFIEERTGSKPDLDALEPNDKRVFKEYTAGHTSGVFQADAAPYRNLLVEMGVHSFEDLIASTALVRPGARNTVGESFIARKHGKEAVSYVHPVMENILDKTYGTVVYQEQLMLAATELGGMSKSDANKLRGIIGKKKDVREFEEYKDRFIDGASKLIEVEQAQQLWHDFEAHAGYSFNRSHSVAYSILSYQTMWLKINYPLEFMCALYRNEGDKDKRVQIFIEMRRLGVPVKLPHINLSHKQATIIDGAIRLGLTDIKYISDNVFNKIDKHRPFRSYEHLSEVKDRKGSGINARAIAAMNQVGAASFDDNPKTGDEPDSYYEYLRVPRFEGRDLPLDVLSTITTLDNYTEDEVHIVKAMVTSLKRDKNKSTGREWLRVEMVDETGIAGIFVEPTRPPEAGQMYMFLVAMNRIMEAVPIDDFTPESEQPFVKFMYNEGERASVGYVEILAIETRFTAKHQRMATLVVGNGKREMRRVLVFPSMYSKVVSKLKPGNILRLKLKKLDDGSLMLQKVE
jgi:DNA polymerase III subunit alpha